MINPATSYSPYATLKSPIKPLYQPFSQAYTSIAPVEFISKEEAQKKINSAYGWGGAIGALIMWGLSALQKMR